jgi:hypothetical protein
MRDGTILLAMFLTKQSPRQHIVLLLFFSLSSQAGCLQNNPQLGPELTLLASPSGQQAGPNIHPQHSLDRLPCACT